MRSHEVDCTIHGDDLQLVEIELNPSEWVIADAGSMMYLTEGITFETKMGDGSESDKSLFGKLKDAGKRAMTGESVFITHFTNNGAGNLKSQFFGGEGLLLATLQGSGRVWLQSLPFSRLADRIAPFGGGSSAGEGSAIGGLLTPFER